VHRHPRNPQQQSITGQAKDNQAKGSTMRFISSIRSRLFALVMLAVSAAAFAQIGISITVGPSSAARVRAATPPRPRLYLDTWVLGLQ
jgi:hypothetical protein